MWEHYLILRKFEYLFASHKASLVAQREIEGVVEGE